MPTSIRQAILDSVAATLDGITTDAGYNVTVDRVYRHREALPDALQYPSLLIADRGDAPVVRRLQAEESVIQIDVVALHRNHDKTKRDDTLSLLAADVRKALVAADTWSGLAIETQVVVLSESQNEAMEPDQTVLVQAQITYRTLVGDPYTVAVL